MTPLDKTLKRSLTINGVDFVVTLTPHLLKLTRKGRRIGMELKWEDITSGESALAIALRASVGRFEPAAKSREGAEGKSGRFAKSQSPPKKSSAAPRGRAGRKPAPRLGR